MCHCVVCREMKKQQWLFKVFSMINSSSSTTSFNNVRLRPFCSATTTSTNLFDPPTVAPPVNSGTFQLKKLKILLEKKLPLLIVPFDYVTKQKYVKFPRKSLDDGGFICDGTLGFISLFDHDEYDDTQLIINNNNKKKKKQLEEVLVYMMHLSKIAKRRICGSSEGWLVTIHRNGQIQLLNPVTKVRVHLPPLTAIPGVSAQFVSDCEDTKGRLCYLDLTDFNIDEPPYYLGSHEFREDFIYKAVTNTTTTTTTTTTSTNPATVVVIIYSHFDRLAFCRTSLSTGNEIDDGADEPAAKRWIEIPTGNVCQKCWNDVTFHKGNFYVVGNFGNVGVVKGLDGPSPFMQCVIDGPEVDDDPDFVVNYLVESPSSSSSGGGDLLMVMRTANYVEETKEKEEEKEENFEHYPYRTIGFKVWKLDLNGPSWEEVKDLGEDGALFIGYNQSFSTSASKFPGCRGNCIYFTDNSQMDVIYPTGGHEIGVYNLVDGSFEKLYETSSSRQLFMPPPVWYVPN